MTRVQILPFGPAVASAIDRYDSRGASAAPLGAGSGAAHIYAVHVEAGGEIGAHDTGFGQLFVIVEGAGWVSADDDIRVPIRAGQAAYFPRAPAREGSDTGMTAVMVQVYDLEPSAPPDPEGGA